MIATIRQQLERDGHAEILVVLKPERRIREDGRLTFDLAGTRDLQAEAASDLTPYFGRFEKSREVIIAKEMRQALRAMVSEGTATVPVPRAKAVRYFPNLGVMLGTVDAKGLQALETSDKWVSAVATVTDVGLIRPQLDIALANDPPTGVSWGIRRIKADRLWQQGLTGDGVTIGHVDTGVDAAHPAIAPAFDAFAAFDRVGEQIIGAAAHDSARHGTHTAGILVGAHFNGFSFGVAPGARLASAMVIEGGQVTARLLGGLDWCVGQNVRIVNISLGFRGYDPQFEAIIRLLRARNILPVVAVGNEGPVTSRSPGNYRESLSVGAVDENDQIWIDSSSERFASPGGYTKPDIIAPGAGVWSSIPRGQMLALSGTSMAAPHIAGLAALLLQHKPNAAVAEIESAILRSATRPPAIASNRGNRGIPDGVAALNLL